MAMHAPRPDRESTREQEERFFAAHSVDAAFIEEVVLFAHINRQNCGPNLPKGYPGIVFWGKGNEKIRDLMQPRGWTNDDSGNVPRVVAPDGTHALTFACGDENVGNPHKDPSTRNPRGEMTEDLVNANKHALLFEPPPPPKVVKLSKCATYILFARKFGHQIRSEISLPVEISGSKITRCEPRFIYPALILPGAAATDDDSDDNNDDATGAPFDIPRK